MGFIQLLASLWPFFKEMFVGEKIKDPASSKRGNLGQSQENGKERWNVLAARWCIDKMQKSRKFLATVVTLLILSLFVNYKLASKLAVVMPRSNEEQVQAEKPPPKDPKEVPTIPRKDSSERDVLFEQTVRELKDLYGEHR